MRKYYILKISHEKTQINIFVQKHRAFKRYQTRKRFIFQQLIRNFADFRRNNSLLLQKKMEHLRNINSGESLYYDN